MIDPPSGSSSAGSDSDEVGKPLSQEVEGPVLEPGPGAEQQVSLPKKKFFRQRAHSNPISDHIFDYPISPDKMDWSQHYPIDLLGEDGSKKVEFLDVGCGYGGLLVELSKRFPQTIMLGFEIRVKVSEYVRQKIAALRKIHPGDYGNIACIRSNAMKYLPNFFIKGQLQKMFFLYPDPHFKKSKHKWRIINEGLLAEYAFVLAVGGIVYTVTDVKDLHDWIVKHFDEHPLFDALPDEEIANDVVATLITDSTEEGKKVTRNDGDKFIAIFRRITPDMKPSSCRTLQKIKTIANLSHFSPSEVVSTARASSSTFVQGSGAGRASVTSAQGSGACRSSVTSAKGPGTGRASVTSAKGPGTGHVSVTSVKGSSTGRAPVTSAQTSGSGRASVASPKAKVTPTPWSKRKK